MRVPWEHFDLRVNKSLLSTPGQVNNSYEYRENVPLTLDEAIFEVAGKAISQKKCFVAKAMWTELPSEQTHMHLQHLFFDSTEELSRQGYFQWIYLLRTLGSLEMSVQPCLSFSSGTHRTITRRNHVRST